ncbi:MAG: phosphoribosylglycinamide formyltransferase [Deltaproteobacteria bacterium]|nr:phosphoribosylglycinamide formyltransferase [Deltaproteobacteria bacterium]
MTLTLGVLASGSGSNFEAIGRAIERGELDAKIAVLVCNKEKAGVFARARDLGIPAVHVSHKHFESREAFEARICEVLAEHGVEWLVLAGFMRLVGATLLSAYPDRILNIHPALLPAFPGLHGARQALEAGVRETGCTVHLVDAGCDTGPRLAQALVPVEAGDDEASLTARIQRQEHRLYPLVLQWIAEGRLEARARRPGFPGLLPPTDDLVIFDGGEA